MTNAQKERLVQIMETEHNFLYGKYNELQVKRWLEVADELNGFELGCKKDPEEWRDSFLRMRFTLSKKMRNTSLQQPSGSPTNVINLSDMDLAIINIMRDATGT